MKVTSSSPAAWIIPFLILTPGLVHGQAAAPAASTNPEDANINGIRNLGTISSVDQAKIERWIDHEITAAENATAANPASALQFRDHFQAQLKNAGNSPAFTSQLVALTAAAVVPKLSNKAFDWHVAHAIVLELANVKQKEAATALLAALKSPSSVVRAVAARGLDDLKTAIAGDQVLLPKVIQELQVAGIAETSGPVLSRIYPALGYSVQAAFGPAFAAYLAIFDARIATRKANPATPDGAETAAFEFLADPEVMKLLTPAQKSALVARVAVFFRLDAERYNAPNLNFPQQDVIERLLSIEEELLDACVGANPQSGKVRAALEQGGWTNRQAVVTEVQKWVGDAASNTQGVVNAAPWSVPVGAP